MTDLERAAIRFIETDTAARDARKALRAGWHSDPTGGKDECQKIVYAQQGAGGLLVDHLTCHKQKIPRESYCPVCAGGQVLWERVIATRNTRTGALLRLRALVGKVGAE